MLTTAVLTSMDHPLGMMIGNSLEVIEAISSLKGNGPEDLNELVAIQGFCAFELIITATKIQKKIFFFPQERYCCILQARQIISLRDGN